MRWIRMIAATFLMVMGVVLGTVCAKAGSIYESPYVSFAPDGKAWTAHAGERQYERYENGTEISTGLSSSLRTPETGEHYYDVERTGRIPVGRWEVKLGRSRCIHDEYPEAVNFHGITYGRQKCRGAYYSGWYAYCADCGEEVSPMLFYLSREAARSINSLETEIDYYYLCPHCSNLEQGRSIGSHLCRAVSYNQYRVEYDPNVGEGGYRGYMIPSYHMYGNAVTYEGKAVTPVKNLSVNRYTRVGYEFVGWNTSADGSGIRYEDGAEIFNLSNGDYFRQGAAGTVKLYAQWRVSVSTLRIDLEGGSRGDGSRIETATEYYGTEYPLKSEEITGPKGFRVSFDTSGGPELAPVIGSTHFAEWIPEEPFGGKLEGDTYYFTAGDGNVDILHASYEPDPIVLPDVHRDNYSFGGWYYDSDCTLPAGPAGQEFIPGADITLYAKWVDLKLWSEENYSVNGGRGAVDLCWEQQDASDKIFRVYQSRDGKNWNELQDVSDLGTGPDTEEAFRFGGECETYTIPYTGMYRLEAGGAQGQNCGNYNGGKGGRISGSFWLCKGDVLTVNVGGRNGFGGGGTGLLYGNGGGSTTVSSAQRGLLLVAGGGGGAVIDGNGGAGGSKGNIREDGAAAGAEGQAGGGAGHVGGNAGETKLHFHTDSCYKLIEVSIPSAYSGYKNTYEESFRGDRGKVTVNHLQYGSAKSLLPVVPGTTLRLEVRQEAMRASGYPETYTEKSYLAVYNQNGKALLNRVGAQSPYVSKQDEAHTFDSNDEYVELNSTFSWGKRTNPQYWYEVDNKGKLLKSSGNYPFAANRQNIAQTADWLGGSTSYYFGTVYYAYSGCYYIEQLVIPTGTTGIYIDSAVYGSRLKENSIKSAKMTVKELLCGYEEGQPEKSVLSGGGSNYAADFCISYESETGYVTGDGFLKLTAEDAGYLYGMELEGVAAPDLAAPESIQKDGDDSDREESGVRYTASEERGGTHILVDWEEPADRGTLYYHVVESYSLATDDPGLGELICRSNVTGNILTSGIAGYYCRVDEAENTFVGPDNGIFTYESAYEVPTGEGMRYLHAAPVDLAGNVGETVHFPVGREDYVWTLYTDPLTLKEEENVYYSDEEGVYYVRCDGMTPFSLQYDAFMYGEATDGFQPNYIHCETRYEGEKAVDTVFVASAESEVSGEVDAGKLKYMVEGRSVLHRYPYTKVYRTEHNKRIHAEQKFLLDPYAEGKPVELIPGVGADYRETVVRSDAGLDGDNGIRLIGDGTVPVLYGCENLEDMRHILEAEKDTSLEIRAVDALSGVKEISVRVFNRDNMLEHTYHSSGETPLVFTIEKNKMLYSGNFTLEIRAVDRVGNENVRSYDATEFSVAAEIKRILPPHAPVFRRGESGILTVTATGYAERLEMIFPEEIIRMNPELPYVFDYKDNLQYQTEEQLQFAVPLDVPPGSEYSITVKAYKGDREIEVTPTLQVMEGNGSVLDDLRTRLR